MHFKSEISVFKFLWHSVDAPQLSEQDLNLQPPDFRSGALNTQPGFLQVLSEKLSETMSCSLHQLFHKVPQSYPSLGIIPEPSLPMHVTVYTCIPNMYPILIAHRMPSKSSPRYPNPVSAWALFMYPCCRMQVTVYPCIPNMHPILIAHHIRSKGTPTPSQPGNYSCTLATECM